MTSDKNEFEANKEIIIVSDKEMGWFTGSIENMINARRKHTIHIVNSHIEAISEKISDNVGLIIINDEGKITDACKNYIKDLSIDRDIPYIYISDNMSVSLSDHIFIEVAKKIYKRPVDLKEVAADVENFNFNSGRKTKIFIFSKSTLTAKTLCSWLSFRYKCFAINDLVDGLSMATLERPDAFVIDDNVGVIGPGDLVKILRENPKTHKVPIMIYSGSRDVDVVKSILESRPDKYILKGIFKDDFVMEVETMIGKNVSKKVI